MYRCTTCNRPTEHPDTIIVHGPTSWKAYCADHDPRDPAAVALGRKGGAQSTPATRAAAKANGAKGGRPLKLQPGDRVEGGSGDDHDTGTVAEPCGPDASHPMAAGPNVYVAWDSGISTWAPIATLRRE